MEYELAGIVPGTHRLTLRGRADAAGVDKVEAGISALVRGSQGHVLVDMAEVPFMGSLGIRMLISLGRLLARRESRLVVFGVQPMVAEVFETMALSDVIPIAADEPAALALVGA